MQESHYRKAQLSNGLTIVAETHQFVRTLSIGVWVKTGSWRETSSLRGISHFLEHMVFKGTQTRSPYQIATVLESLGGELNAFTERETTCYHATVLSEHVDVALDILSDILLHPLFPKLELERERKVLLQELSMLQEAPEDWIHDLFVQSVWKNQPLGHPIIGSKKSVKEISRRDLITYWEENYIPENMVISLCGNVDFEYFQERCEHYFRFKKRPARLLPSPGKSVYKAKSLSEVSPTDQLHLLVGYEGVGYRDPYRFEALLLSLYLGGGMSSRLFQEVREKAGLAYTVECEFAPYQDTGLFAIYAAISPKHLSQCLAILKKELERLLEAPLSDAELNIVKGQLRGMIELSSDYMDVRQESLGKNETTFGRYVSVDELIAEINQVTPERIQQVAQRIFVPEGESVFTLSRKKPKKRGGILK